MKFNISFQYTLSAIIMSKIILIIPIDDQTSTCYLKIFCFQGICGFFYWVIN